MRPLVLRHAYQSETRRYTPRRPERTLLYRTVAENLETLLRTAREQNESGHGLPKYVEQEFRAQRAMFHSLPSLEPVELIAVAFNVYRRFAEWLKKKGLIRLADADDSYEKEDPLASCLRRRH